MKRLFIIMAAGVMLTGCNGNSSSSAVTDNNIAIEDTSASQESITGTESTAAYSLNEDTSEFELDPAETLQTTADNESESGEDKADNTTPSAETTEQGNAPIDPLEGEQIDPFE